MASSPVTPLAKSKTQATIIASDILDDLASRFIINVPDEERQNLIRICFQIELANWFYLDFYCSGNKQKCGMKQFAFQIFQHVPFLQPHLMYVEKILEDWKQYKLSVPTYGAILLSEDLKNVLLVQSFWAKSSWGFPKGKINENEEPLHCAIREVYEETGYDISKLIVPHEYIELVINYQYTRLYLVSGVPMSTVFEPKTRNEIKCCEWFPIDLLPVTKHDSIVKDNTNMNGNSFFMILPFIKNLKKWLDRKQKGKHIRMNNSPNVMMGSGVKPKNYFDNNNKQNKRQRHKSMGDIERPKSNGNGLQYFSNNAHYSKISEPLAKFELMQVQQLKIIKASDNFNQIGGSADAYLVKKSMVKLNEHKNVIKRKLFENETKPVISTVNSNISAADSNSPWLNFKLDYSKFF